MTETEQWCDEVAALMKLDSPAGRGATAVDELGLTEAHADELIRLAMHWADDEYDFATYQYGPIWAWRALGELRCRRAVGPLIKLAEGSDRREDDDFSLGELPMVFAHIGPETLPPLERLLKTGRRRAGMLAAEALEALVMQHPQTRKAAVSALQAALEDAQPKDSALNAVVAWKLIDLRAVEAAETIERAFSRNAVDCGYQGGWEDARRELGVEGLGLPQPARPKNSLRDLQEQFRGLPLPARTQDDRRKRKLLKKLGKRKR